MVPPLVETAYAKVNLFLHVTGHQDNCYHDLETLFAFTEFGDVLRIERSDSTTLEIHGPQSVDLSTGPDNLVYRSVKMLSTICGQKLAARVVLDKRIPVAAGLGGGSADAGAVMRSLIQLYDLKPPTDLLHSCATKLGADIPACYTSNPAIGRGRGERLQPIDLVACPILLVNPGVKVSTAGVFQRFKETGQAFSPPGRKVGAIESLAELIRVLETHHNDLQSVAITITPEIGTVLNVLRSDASCLLGRMSGSGATCFGLFETMERAQTAAVRISRDYPGWWVMPTTLMPPLAIPRGK